MTSRSQYFESLKALAREKRVLYNVETGAFGLRQVRKIYTAERVRIDAWPRLPSRIKAIYMCEDGDCSVAIQPKLPEEPRLFALVHELKHHYRDQDVLRNGTACCGDYNAHRDLEIGAEVFAAEFIYPEYEFHRDIDGLQVSCWTPEDVVEFKRMCSAKVSYTFICKRLGRFGLIEPRQFDGVKFKKLEEQMYGVPFYRQEWFRESRQRSRST